MIKFKFLLLICGLIKLSEATEAQSLAPICQEQDIIYNDENIKLSDVIQSLKTITEKTCNGQRLLIFATDKFIVDANYAKIKNESSVVIMAPELIVENNFNIELIGKDARKHKDAAARDGKNFMTQSGMNGLNGKDGRDGKPGYPGACGGSIFSIALTTEKLEMLTFKSKGGDGSPGQDGGRGGRGSDGADSKPGDLVVGLGGTGGIGGKGGKGGYGGHSGTIFFKNKDGKQLNIQQIEGSNGADGRGAYSGNSGKNGKITHHSADSAGTRGSALEGEGIISIFRKTTTTVRPKKPRRTKSADGANVLNMQDPENSAFENQAAVLNKYKQFALKRLTIAESFSEKLNLFLQYLDEVSVQNKFYDAVSYVNELRILDENIIYVKNRNSLLPLYQSLQNRIVADAQIINSPILMKRLKSHITDVINDSNDDAKNLDIDSSLETLTRKNKVFQSIKTTIEDANDIGLYKKGIYESIFGGVYYIENKLMPKIESINVDIQNYIEDNIVDELIRNEQKIKRDNEELSELMPKAAIASSLKIAGSFCSILGAVFTAGSGFGLASMAVGSVANYIGDGIFDVSEVNNLIKKQATNLKDVELRLRSIKTIMNDMSNEKSEVLRQQLMILPADKQRLINSKLGDLEKDAEKYESFQKLLKEEGKNYFDNMTLDKLSMYATVFESSMDIYNQIKNNANNMEVMSDIIAVREEHLEKIYALRDFVNNDLMKVVQSIVSVIDGNLIDVSEKKHIGLRIAEIEIKGSLDKLRNILNSITGPETKDGLANLMQDLSDSYGHLFDIYNLIADENKDKKIGELIRRIPNAYNLTDSKLIIAAIDLDCVNEANNLLETYKPFTYNMLQYVFPFSGGSFGDFMLDTSLSLIYLANTASLDVPKIEKVYNQYHNNYATKFTLTTISNAYPYTKEQAEEVLKKKEITFRTKTSYSALKFDKISVKIVLNQKADNEKPLSDFFDFELEHMGNSFYKCDSDRYMMANAHKTFQLHTDGEWKTTQLSPYLLSPTTLWKIKLTPKRNSNFKNFAITNMNIELSFSAKYLKNESKGVCSQLPDYKPYCRNCKN